MTDLNNLTPEEKDSLRSMNMKRIVLMKKLIAVPVIMLGFVPIYFGIEDATTVNDFTFFAVIMAVLAGLTWRAGVVGFIEAFEMQKFNNALEYLEFLKKEKDRTND